MDFLFSPVVIWSGRVLYLCFLTGLRGEVGFGRPAGTAAGGGGATALVGRQTVVEVRRRHTLSCGFITHTLQLVTHRGALTWNQFNKYFIFISQSLSEHERRRVHLHRGFLLSQEMRALSFLSDLQPIELICVKQQ